MQIRLDLTKNLQENAAEYFQKAKKAKNKLPGAQQALTKAQEKAKKSKEETQKTQQRIQLQKPKEHWYHKYHWSKTTTENLLIAGSNAAANETLIKHQTTPEDLIFHTDMAGSPFTILQAKTPTQQDLQEAAQLTAAYSKAWSKGLATLEVFYVKPEQVTKEAQSGEYLSKGSFMIRGETNYLHPEVRLCIGVIKQEGYEKEVFVGSKESCKKHCSEYAEIIPGEEKTSDVAKQLRKRLGGDLDAYIKAIPAGGSKIHAWYTQ
ncbi:MAG: NFACT RNA binding domain-containing protein [Candidatus Woesearchaeota archaeon]